MKTIMASCPRATPADLTRYEFVSGLVEARRKMRAFGPAASRQVKLAADSPAVFIGGRKSLRDDLQLASSIEVLEFDGGEPTDLYFYVAREKFRVGAAVSAVSAPKKLVEKIRGPRATVFDTAGSHLANCIGTAVKEVTDAHKKFTVILVALSWVGGVPPSGVARGVRSPVTCGQLYDILRGQGWVE